MLPCIMNLSLQSLEEAVAIRRQIEQLESRLTALFQSAPPSGTSTARRTMSAAQRARIAVAQRARWAKQKSSSAAMAAQEPRRKGQLTAAGRKKLSDLMKARWAARKKTGAPNKPSRVRK